MVQDTINSIRVTLNERIGNPFISATLIACVLLNWKLSLLLFSDVPYDNKIEKILALYPDRSARLDLFLIYPLFFGAFWTFIWPLINLVVNTYWYWMKSNLANFRLKAERKKMLSEGEAAELYSTIDAQEGKYLEFLKDRQNRIDKLGDQLKESKNEREDLQLEFDEQRSKKEDLEIQLSEARRELDNIRNSINSVSSENREKQAALSEIIERSLENAEYFPTLKIITNIINEAKNFQADESWVKQELRIHEPTLTEEAQNKMFNLLLALGFIRRDLNNQILFGDRYRSIKDRVLGMYNNSPR